MSRTTTREGTLSENYKLLDRLGINVPFFEPFDEDNVYSKLKEIDERDISDKIGVRFDQAPKRITPEEFYSLAEENCPESIYSNPPDRYSDKWLKNPHLIGDYEKTGEFLVEAGDMGEFSGCIDYEVGGPHYFDTQKACFNLYFRDGKAFLEGSSGQKTSRSDDRPEFNLTVEEWSLDELEGELPSSMDKRVRRAIQRESNSIYNNAFIPETDNLIFENSCHESRSGKRRKKVVTWDILDDGTEEGKKSLKRLRDNLL